MRCESEAYLPLRERVEARSLLEDAPELVVEALDVRLLRRAVRVAEPDVYAARQQLRRVVFGVRAVFLDHLRLGELRAVVGQDRAEEPHEERGPRDAPEHVEDPELLQIVDERGRTAPFVYNRSSSN